MNYIAFVSVGVGIAGNIMIEMLSFLFTFIIALINKNASHISAEAFLLIIVVIDAF